jgi:predicted Zn-dependent protease
MTPQMQLRLLVCVCLALSVAGLSVAGSSVAAAINLVSVADEIKLGREAQRQVKAQTPQVDGAAGAYVAGLGRQLAARADGPRYPYSFSVANYRDVNAFALPGGPVWVNRGAIQAARTEAQIAGVLAHEIAHVSQRHAAQQISKGAIANGLLGLFGALLGNSGGARAAQTGAQVLAGGYMMKFSRDDEREADRIGTQCSSSCRSSGSSRGAIRVRSKSFCPRIHLRPSASSSYARS